MTEFKHSIVLFSGDDGLPIEFNIRNTLEKLPLKAMIEYGGGLCTLSDEAVYLISPGTRVLNVDREKKLISSRYIFDCVKENYLLELDDYVVKITEVETSDISEEDSVDVMKNALMQPEESIPNCSKDNEHKSPVEPSDLNVTFLENNNLDVYGNAELIPHLKSETVINNSIKDKPNSSSTDSDISKYLSPQKHESSTTDKPTAVEKSNNVPDNSFSDILEDADNSLAIIPETDSNNVENKQVDVCCSPESNNDIPSAEPHSPIAEPHSPIAEPYSPIAEPYSPIHAVVVSSSQNSQPPVDALDGFDNLLLSKLHEQPVEEEDSLSQSYTVSSSADAQVSAKATPEDNSAEMFAAASVVPDSASQNSQPTERESYIKTLEAEVECILRKPFPKSIQDKICLVKYLCCVKKMSPNAVLQSLPSL